MSGFFSILLLFCHLLLLTDPSSSFPLCTDLRLPFTVKSSLAFCSYNGSICCDSAEDLRLQKQFQDMNISDPACASLLKSILCTICDQFSAQLFKIDSGLRTVPILCNSTVSVNAYQSKRDASNGFCEKVWDKCSNVAIFNSPFSPSLLGRAGIPSDSTSSRLINLWQSKSDFCKTFGGSSDDDEAVCFNGEPVLSYKTETPPPPKGLCLEKIGNGSYLNMVAHPDGSNHVFLSNQQGKIWLATVPEEGSGRTLELDESKPFLDITDEVHYDTDFGLMGLAFHPNFVHSGRFFVSFNCDKVRHPGCSGRCSCNSDVNCDPSKLDFDNRAQPCQYHSVVAEFTVNGTASHPSLAKSTNPSEVRRIFTIGLPYKGGHAGQILFGPTDGNLYLILGDGSDRDDPYNFAQNKKSLLGKILRFDVDIIPSEMELNDLGIWGNYSIPRDNPYVDDKELLPEIWALGLRNPWRCSFDSERPSYFLCGDTGQDQYEEVDIITKGGNYGWRVYEGPYLFRPAQSPGGNTSASSINPIFPVMGYSHSDVNSFQGSASISGGYFYRSMTDPCMYGRYLYTDLYAVSIWTGIENPENSGKFTTAPVSFRCARNSPIQCSSVKGRPRPDLGYVFSLAEDNKKDIFFLTSNGVYRVAKPSRCNYTCSKEKVKAAGISRPGASSSSSAKRLRGMDVLVLLPLWPILLVLDFYLVSCI